MLIQHNSVGPVGADKGQLAPVKIIGDGGQAIWQSAWWFQL